MGLESSQLRSSVIGRNASWVVVQVVVSTIVLFVVYYVLVRAVGIDQIGLLAIVSTMAVAARLSELGLSGAVTRFVAEYLARDERAEAGQVIVTAAVALSLSGGLGVFLVWPVLQAILPFIIDERLVRSTHVLLPATLFALWMNIVSGCLLMSLDGVNRADRRAQITVLSQGVFAVVTIVMIRPLGIVAIPVGQTAQAMCVFLLATLVLGGELPETMSARPTITCFMRIWRYGAQLQLITLLILFYDPGTKLLLNHYGTLSAVGYFDMANRLIGQIRSVIVSANQVMVPHYAMLNATNPGMLAGAVRANFQLLIKGSSVVFSLLSVSLFLISKLWTGVIDLEFIKISMILIIGAFANVLNGAVYFKNMATNSLTNNVKGWFTIVIVTITGGVFGGIAFGVTGVVVSISAGLIAGTIVTTVAYMRSTRMSLRSLGSNSSIRFAFVGCLVFCVALASVVRIHAGDDERIVSFVAIGLGIVIWFAFICVEARVSRQSPLSWAREMIASLQRQ